jgi:hypothetical protein
LGAPWLVISEEPSRAPNGGSARGYRDFATPYAIRTATLAPVAETPGERFERCHFESVLDL